MKSLYLLLHLFTISVPLIRSFEPRVQYARKWKALLPGLMLTAAIFLLWDLIFTRLGIWGFNEMYILGIYFLGLPVEEWLFFITIPFATVFIYECIVYFLPHIPTGKILQGFTFAIALSFLMVSLLNIDKAYTFWNLLFTSSYLAYIAYKNPAWLGKFWVTYVIHLIPFLLVNGILTGSFIEEQVVWYNNQENLSIRIRTIPIEDFVYSLLLLLMNVSFFEWFKRYYKLR